jgi:hypothetical protein
MSHQIKVPSVPAQQIPVLQKQLDNIFKTYSPTQIDGSGALQQQIFNLRLRTGALGPPGSTVTGFHPTGTAAVALANKVLGQGDSVQAQQILANGGANAVVQPGGGPGGAVGDRGTGISFGGGGGFGAAPSSAGIGLLVLAAAGAVLFLSMRGK